MKNTDTNRRQFLVLSTTGVASLLVACPKQSKNRAAQLDLGTSQSAQPDARLGTEDSTLRGTDANVDSAINGNVPDTGTASADTGTASADTDASSNDQCVSTSSDIAGPYWREGVPIRSNFDLYNDNGTRLTLSGTVRDAQCTPVSNVVLEVWHANPTTVRAADLSNSDTVDYDLSSSQYKYYGQLSTDTDGRYSLVTKKPGWYLNGRSFRPSHIHVRVYVDNIEKLTTQLYFQDDPFITNDPWASVAPKRTIELQRDVGGNLSGRFDFTLA
jgi:protocatechuate 3,4-dioxygenase beta subunit